MNPESSNPDEAENQVLGRSGEKNFRTLEKNLSIG